LTQSHSPYINRFLQPDSIIPSPATPQTLNRYSYVGNQPIIYIDPSGHTYLCGESCEAEDEQTQHSVDNQAALYGITFGPGWSATSKAKTLLGIMTLAKSMKDAYNSFQNDLYHACLDNMDAPGSCSKKSTTDVEVFTTVFGDMTFKVHGTSAGWMCAANSGGFNCSAASNGGDINPKLAIHELGHTFNSVYDPKGILPYVTPYGVLGSASIYTAQGIWVAGLHTVDKTWKWDRNPGFDGYTSNGVPGVFHGSATWSDWNAPGIAVGEEFADMFMNWAFNSFSRNSAGQARYAWMSSQMGSWLNSMVP
jgi:hypothetical protein